MCFCLTHYHLHLFAANNNTMHHRLTSWMIASFAILTVSVVADNTEISPEKMKTYSYAIGLTIGQSMRQQQINLEIDSFTLGIKDAMDGTTTMSQQQLQDTMLEFQQALQKITAAKLQAVGASNAEAGKKFLAENAKKDGVKTTPSGLQYKIEKPGKGSRPTANDVVSVHYRGTTVDGTEFDSSYSRGQPATFPLNGVISGWTEGLQLISEGGKIRLFIPPDLAYGEKGADPLIGPNATLIFDVELLDILPSASANN